MSDQTSTHPVAGADRGAPAAGQAQGVAQAEEAQGDSRKELEQKARAIRAFLL